MADAVADAVPTGFLRHRKVGTIEDIIDYGMDPELPVEDPRRVTLELPGQQEIAHYRLPRVYFNEATDSSVKLAPIKPQLINNKPANDNFQESLLACLLNLSPVLNLLEITARKHAIWNTRTLNHTRPLLDLKRCFWASQIDTDTQRFSEEWYELGGNLADGLSKTLVQPQGWRTKDKSSENFLHQLFDAPKKEDSLFPITEMPGPSWEDLQVDEKLIWARILGFTRIPREPPPTVCPLCSSELTNTPEDYIVGNRAQYLWQLNVRNAEKTSIEDLITHSSVSRRCNSCNGRIPLEGIPRFLYPPEVLITRHVYVVDEKGEGNRSTGSLQFPEYLDLTAIMEPIGADEVEDVNEDEENNDEEADDEDEDNKQSPPPEKDWEKWLREQEKRDDTDEGEKIYRLQAVISKRWGGEDFFTDYSTCLRREEGVWTRLYGTTHETTSSKTVSFADILRDDVFKPIMLFWVRDRSADKSDLTQANQGCEEADSTDLETFFHYQKDDHQKGNQEQDGKANDDQTDEEDHEYESEGELEINNNLQIELQPEFLSRASYTAGTRTGGQREIMVNMARPQRVAKREDVVAFGFAGAKDGSGAGGDSDVPSNDSHSDNGPVDDDSVPEDEPSDPRSPSPSAAANNRRRRPQLVVVPVNEISRAAVRTSQNQAGKPLRDRLTAAGLVIQWKSTEEMRRAYAEHFEPPETGRVYEDYTMAKLKKFLEAAEISYPAGINRQDLVRLCRETDERLQREDREGRPHKKPRTS